MQNNIAVPTLSESSEPKLTKRQRQAQQTKNRIFRAAMEVINEKGFNNTTIEDITAHAGVASGSFYTYFKSKEIIIQETFHLSDEIYEWAYQKTGSGPFLTSILKFVRLSYTKYERRGKGIIKAFISNYFSFPDYNFYRTDRPLFRCLKDLTEKGVAAGEVSPALSVDEYVLQLISVLTGIEIMWCFDETGRSLTDMAVAAIRTMALGMMLPDARSGR